MKWSLIAALLLGFLIAQWMAPTQAQAPHSLFVSSSAGAVLAQGSTSGVLTVNVQ